MSLKHIDNIRVSNAVMTIWIHKHDHIVKLLLAMNEMQINEVLFILWNVKLINLIVAVNLHRRKHLTKLVLRDLAGVIGVHFGELLTNKCKRELMLF
jgi:hypothetical protein